MRKRSAVSHQQSAKNYGGRVRQAFQSHKLLLGLLVVTTLLALPVLTYPLGRDQGEFATIGRGILDGHVPYKELWNPKPPAVFYVYALAMTLFGRTTAALRAIDLVIAPVISAGLYWLGGQVANRRVGLWAALIFPVFYFTESFWTLTQNEGIALLPMTLGMVCLFKAVSHRPSAVSFQPSAEPSAASPSNPLVSAFLAGALAGYTVWFKYPFMLFAGMLVLGAMLLHRKTTPAFSTFNLQLLTHRVALLRFLLAFVGGGLLVGLGGSLVMLSIGAWDDLAQSAQVTAQYTALTFNLDDFGALLVTALGFRWQQWGLLWLLAGLWFVVGRLGERRGQGWMVILLWALSGLAIMLAQAKAYDYHWLPMLPPLALLAADSVDRLLGWGVRSGQRAALSSQRSVVSLLLRGMMVVAFLGILAVGIWPRAWSHLSGQEDQTGYYHRFQAGEFVADESLLVANLLRERVAPGDSLFIWGFRPEVYYLSQLNPASRFIFHFPLVGSWYPPEWRDEVAQTLWAAMPPYALVLQVDYMPWVTGSPDDSNTLLQGYTELNNWLMANYERDTQIGNFFVWRRKR